MSITIRSNKDGNSGSRATGFSAAEPNTYAILRDGVVVGRIENRPNYPLSNINPNWGGRGAWVAYIDGAEVAADQYLRRLRAAVLNFRNA